MHHMIHDLYTYVRISNNIPITYTALYWYLPTSYHFVYGISRKKERIINEYLIEYYIIANIGNATTEQCKAW